MVNAPSPDEGVKQKTIINDKSGEKIINLCDSNLPLVAFGSKVVRIGNSLLTICRIFSGTLKSGSTVSLLAQKFQKGSKEGYLEKKINHIYVFTGQRTIYEVEQAQCGTIVAIPWIENCFESSVTLCNWDLDQAIPIRPIYYPHNHSIMMSISPRSPADLPKLIEGIRELKRLNQMLEIPFEETGNIQIRAVSQAYLEACVDELEKKVLSIEIEKSEFYPIYKESILGKTSDYILTKGPNKFNRLFGTAEKLDYPILQDIDSGKFLPHSFDTK